MQLLTPLIGLAQKYFAAFRHAWKFRHELAGPSRLTDENAFLPASLSLQETPLHPAPRRFALAIMTLFLIAIAWSMIGDVDIVAVAPGRLVVSERTKLIQPITTSTVKRVLVQDGDHVEPNQPLIELDATNVNADRVNNEDQLKAVQSDIFRARSLLKAIAVPNANTPSIKDYATSNWTKTDILAAESYIVAEWSDINAKRAKLGSEISRRQAEITTVRAVISKLEMTLPIVKQREEDFKKLAEQGFMSSHAGQDRTKDRIEIEKDLLTQKARLSESQAALRESESTRTAYISEVIKSLHERETNSELKRLQIIQERVKVDQKTNLTTLTSPVKGVVQQLNVHTVGGVVTEAQTLMVVVPEESQIRAEVMVDNKDIGFIYAGQEAELKLETFNFTRYGTVNSTVQTISADAIVDEKKGALFSTMLKLKASHIDIDGKLIKLTPGMNITAEVKTGKRKIIEFLLSPLQKSSNESLRER